MQFTSKFKVMTVLIIALVFAVVAFTPTDHEEHFTNLKVLPKHISSKELSSIMIDDFEDGLGVGCSFCHAEQKGSHRLDYASDEKPEKNIARSMMRMTLNINKKYFDLRHPMIGDSLLTITCSSCHQGQPHPSRP